MVMMPALLTSSLAADSPSCPFRRRAGGPSRISPALGTGPVLLVSQGGPDGLVVVLVLVAALLAAAVVLLARTVAARRRTIAALEEQLRVASQSAAQLRRLDQEVMLVNAYLVEFSDLVQEFIANVELRRIPELLANTVQRMFRAEYAAMLVRRVDKTGESEVGHRLIVAAVANAPRDLETGAEVPYGVGHLGLVAEVKRTLSRDQAEREEPAAYDPLPRFDLAAPLVVENETIGVIAYAGPIRHHPRNADILEMVARLGAMAWHTVSAYRHAKVSADLDGLTGVLNKRVVRHRFGELLLEARESGGSVAVFLFDIDHFKNYNDVNGHLAGDNALRTLARIVSDTIRAGDVFGRFGGEEFLLVMRNLKPAQAMRAATNVARRVSAHQFPCGERQPLGRLTVSGGVACYPEDGGSSVELLRLADEALYRAKKAGRDRVFRAQQGVGDGP